LNTTGVARKRLFQGSGIKRRGEMGASAKISEREGKKGTGTVATHRGVQLKVGEVEEKKFCLNQKKDKKIEKDDNRGAVREVLHTDRSCVGQEKGRESMGRWEGGETYGERGLCEGSKLFSAWGEGKTHSLFKKKGGVNVGNQSSEYKGETQP